MHSVSDSAGRKYRDSESPSGNLSDLNGGIRIGEPDALAPFHKASADEKRRRIRDVLQWGHSIYRRGGASMVEAVSEAAAGSATGYYALVELRRVLLELNLVAWEQHPHRTRADVHRAFKKAIGRLTPHRGGWRVSR